MTEKRGLPSGIKKSPSVMSLTSFARGINQSKLRLASIVVLCTAFVSTLPPPVQALDSSTRTINAGDVWSELGITGKGVTVAVIDSGSARA